MCRHIEALQEEMELLVRAEQERSELVAANEHLEVGLFSNSNWLAQS